MRGREARGGREAGGEVARTRMREARIEDRLQTREELRCTVEYSCVPIYSQEPHSYIYIYKDRFALARAPACYPPTWVPPSRAVFSILTQSLRNPIPPPAIPVPPSPPQAARCPQEPRGPCAMLRR